MEKTHVQELTEVRQQARERFNRTFYGANTMHELIQAYAKYCGTLEGILDTIEIIEHCK